MYEIDKPQEQAEPRRHERPAALANSIILRTRQTHKAAAPKPPPAAMKPAVPNLEAPAARPEQAVLDELRNIDMRRVFNWVFRWWPVTAVTLVVGMLAGVAFGTLMPPRYTAYTDILIDTTNLQVVDNAMFGQAQQRDSQLLTVESKTRVLTSGNVITRVVEQLDLKDDREFGGTSGGEEERALAARRVLYDRLTATRAPSSLVVTLAIWAQSPDKSVLISDAVVSAFQAELAIMDASSAGRVGQDISSRLVELRQSVILAEEAVETYRAEHNLQLSNGELLNSQSMAQINAELVAARNRLSEAEARHASLAAAFANNITTGPEVASETVAALRSQHGVLTQQLNALSMRLGPRHPEILALQPQINAIAAQIRQEIGRQVAAARSDTEQARAVVEGLQAQDSQIRSSVSVNNAALVELRELEREAEARASIYEALLARSAQVDELSNVAGNSIQVISAAVPPASRSFPPRTIVLAGGGAIGGLGLGLALAALAGLLFDLSRHVRPFARKLPRTAS